MGSDSQSFIHVLEEIGQNEILDTGKFAIDFLCKPNLDCCSESSITTWKSRSCLLRILLQNNIHSQFYGRGYIVRPAIYSDLKDYSQLKQDASPPNYSRVGILHSSLYLVRQQFITPHFHHSDWPPLPLPVSLLI